MPDVPEMGAANLGPRVWVRLIELSASNCSSVARVSAESGCAQSVGLAGCHATQENVWPKLATQQYKRSEDEQLLYHWTLIVVFFGLCDYADSNATPHHDASAGMQGYP